MSPLKSDEFKNKLHALREWPAISSIEQTLRSVSRECWVSGGAVRDVLLGQTPFDIDLTTDATDHEIIQLFPNAVLVGRQFGVYKIPISGLIIDLTVFRAEDEYLDGRRPTSIRRSTPEDDAKRRDFTINALFWNLAKNSLVDFVGGHEDLKKGLLRTVGSSAHRFLEDHLRILRLARFAAQFNFKIEDETRAAAYLHADLVATVSGERFWAELLKLKDPTARRSLFADSLFQKIMKHNGLEILHSLTWSVPKDFGVSLDQVLLFELVHLVGVDVAALNLGPRFKVSKAQRLWLALVIEGSRMALAGVGFEKWISAIERSPDFLKIFRLCHFAYALESSFVSAVENFLRSGIEHVITPYEILSRVRPQDVGRALTEVRERQVLGLINSRDQALAWVEKMYPPKDQV